MAKKKAKAAATEEPTFEESLAQLEAVVADLEGGELGLSDALSRYEEGVRRLKQCHAQLRAAERKIELLSGVDADGNVVTEPFDDSATGADASPSRSQKRSAGGRGPSERPDDRSGGVDGGTRLF